MTDLHDHDQARWAQFADDVRRFAAPTGNLPTILRERLQAADLIRRYPTNPAGPKPGVFVDGAVAAEQTDALTIVAAVAATTLHDTDWVTATEGVVPVSGDGDRYRAILMASCELDAALHAHTATTGHVFVDGGLGTTLLSVATTALIRDADVAAQTSRHLTDRGTLDTVDRYVNAVLGGRIVGLPKQDTAQTYVHQWADRWHTHLGDNAQILRRLRDRPLIDLILQPGEILAPRPASELRRIDAPTSREPDPHTAALTEHLGRLRDATTLQVAYFKPNAGAQRTIKIEYTNTPPGAFLHLAATLDRDCDSPRILEPYGQHSVDQVCKTAVRRHLATVLDAVTRALADHPEAARHYRT